MDIEPDKSATLTAAGSMFTLVTHLELKVVDSVKVQ